MKKSFRRYLAAAIVCTPAIGTLLQAAPPTNASNLPSPNATIRNSTPAQPAASKSSSWVPWAKSGAPQSTAGTPAPAKTTPNAATAEVESEVMRGRNFEKVGDWDKARKVYTELQKKYPSHPAPAHRLGIVADHQRKHVEAERLFTTAIQLDPRNADYQHDLGYCYYLQGRFKESEAMLRRAVQMKPNTVRYHNNLALALGQQGRHTEALQHLAVGGSEADAYYNLAFIFASQERPNEAKECFRKALAIDPRHQKAREALGSFAKYESLPDHMKETDEYIDGSGRKWIPFLEGQAQPTESLEGVVKQASAETPVPGRDLRQLNQEMTQRMRTGTQNR